MEHNNSSDVVIIGGGIAGVSTLYYLTQCGIKNVWLIEKSAELALGITRHTAGQVMLQMDNEFDILLSQRSLKEIKELENITGINLYKQKTGMLTVAPGVKFPDKLEKWFERQESLNIPTEIWDTPKIRARVPLLNTQDIDFGIYSEQDGVVNADLLVKLYAKLAKARGAKVVTGSEVTNIITRNNKIYGVETNKQEIIRTRIVVNAAGLYAKAIGHWIGLNLPLINSWRFNGFTHLLDPDLDLVPRNMPTVEVLNKEPDKIIYVGPQNNCIDFTIGVFSVEKFGDNASPKLMLEDERYYTEFEARFPRLFDNKSYQNPQGGQFDEKRSNGSPRCSVRHEEYPEDSKPILGPVESIEGYFNNCGWGGLGITHGPIGGMLVANSIAKTKNFPINIEPFLLQRFTRK